ncbi:hypothetical protein RZO85_29800, partial [Raoultella ornithinolytica]|nr:hypothetical protein [Raoultella ornithinolytica]
SAQIREILISESAWEEMTCLFAPSLELRQYLFSPRSICAHALSAIMLFLIIDGTLFILANTICFLRKSKFIYLVKC